MGVLVITALFDELQALLDLGDQGRAGWTDAHDARGYPYRFRNDGNLRIAAAWSGAMGETAASSRAQELIDHLSPTCLAMCGICAGRREDVGLGDVIVADRVFSYDHGKLLATKDAQGQRREEPFHDFESYNLRKSWAMDATYLAQDFSWCASLVKARPLPLAHQRGWLLQALLAHLHEGGLAPQKRPERASQCPDWERAVLSLEKKKWVAVQGGALVLTEEGLEQARREQLIHPDGLPPPPPFRVHVGPIATGKTVRQDPELFSQLAKLSRKTLGAEMEAAAIGYVAERAGIPSLIVKAVSDFGDEDKDDGFRAFACKTSALLLLTLLKRHLPGSKGGATKSSGPAAVREEPLQKASFFEGPRGGPALRVPHFTGREDDLARMRDALSGEGGAVCVVAAGTGGIGKTALVQQLVATQAPTLFPEGAAWFDGESLFSELPRVAQRFGWAGAADTPPPHVARWLERELHSRKVLLVVDNVQEDTSPDLLPLPGGAARTLLTTRSFVLHENLGRPAQQLRLERWSDEACRSYLIQILPGLASTPADELDWFAHLTGGLPLAIRLVARLLMRPGATCASVRDRLSKEPIEALDSVAKGADRGVAATFLVSFGDLSQEEREVLLALSASAPATTADVVAGVVGAEREATNELLAGLAESSLAEYTAGAERPWGLHDVLRLFVRKQPGAREAILKHRAFVVDSLSAHLQSGLHHALAADVPEALAASDTAIAAGEGSEALQPLLGIYDFMRDRGGSLALAMRLDRVLRLVPENSNHEALAAKALGGALLLMGDALTAARLLKRARDLFQQLGIEATQGDCEGILGLCHLTLADLPRAIAHLERARQIDERLGRRRELAASYGNLALCYRTLGDVEKAIEFHQRALEIDRQVGNTQGEAADLGGLGLCYSEQGDLPKAIEYQRRSLDVATRAELPATQADALGNLGVCLLMQGNTSEAKEFLGKAIALNRRMSRSDRVAIGLNLLGGCYRLENNLEKAVELHLPALELAEQLGMKAEEANAHANLGACYFGLDQEELARVHVQRAVELFRASGLPDTHPRVRQLLDALAP